MSRKPVFIPVIKNFIVHVQVPTSPGDNISLRQGKSKDPPKDGRGLEKLMAILTSKLHLRFFFLGFFGFHVMKLK